MCTSDRLIERAAELWCRALKSPRFNNGDDSSQGVFTTALASLNIEAAQQKSGDIDSKIEVFRGELSKILLGKKAEQSQRRGYFWADLSCDYAPEDELAEAAAAAGVDTKLFSVKSSVYINDGYVTSKFGYGAVEFNHYPLEDGRWLITTLKGSDMDKVIASIANGNPLGLLIDS